MTEIGHVRRLGVGLVFLFCSISVAYVFHRVNVRTTIRSLNYAITTVLYCASLGVGYGIGMLMETTMVVVDDSRVRQQGESDE